ncbi:relaxase/mobilization nuclease domain-containing protein [Loktanella sp. M215]|uniref:relaxase/mobilization nuclease domain-containing protein n=1 Tax=Loktanella sp. M215 TaxID=2675431 RepID=UPI001F27D3A9|nr:hypothetical protein [Loktanella sp. M215]
MNGKAKGIFGFAPGVSIDKPAFDQADLDQMMSAWAQDWKGRPRNGHTSHMVLSFPDDVSQDAAFVIAQQWCAEMFEDQTHIADTWEYVAALHTDTANPHVHVVLNNRGECGTWFSISSEGVFNPQMMRDRMTDIADNYGLRLESLTRADRGLYGAPITSAAVFAAREGRTLATPEVKSSLTSEWRRQDMRETAELYTTLAEFAETIGAPMIAKRAYISAAALFAGDEVPKGQMMDIDLDVTADREDIRTSLIGWAEQNKDAIDALPESRRASVMSKIDTALNIIETDVAPDLTDDTIWPAFKETPSSYLIPDTGALEARAALYVKEENADLLQEFVNTNVLESYLVTGDVPNRFKPVMPAVANAYAEMHNHRLAEIPKEMKAYVQKGARMGLDRVTMQERLINAIGDPVENARIERGDIAAIAAAMPTPPRDVKAFEDASQRMMEAATLSVNDGLSSPLDVFENLAIARDRTETATGVEGLRVALDQLGTELLDLAEARKRGDLTAQQVQAFDAVAPELFSRYADAIPDAMLEMAHNRSDLSENDRQVLYPEMSAEEHEQQNLKDANSRVRAFERAAMTLPADPLAVSDNFQVAANLYRDWQMDLGKVEERIIADSKVYDRDGVARVMQDVANTAATTGRADLADSAAGRQMLTAFVALEGRGAMQEIASGKMDALSEYVDTPANQRLVAKELLKSAKSVDVGLGLDEIETGLEAVDPNYSRSRGISI